MRRTEDMDHLQRFEIFLDIPHTRHERFHAGVLHPVFAGELLCDELRIRENIRPLGTHDPKLLQRPYQRLILRDLVRVDADGLLNFLDDGSRRIDDGDTVRSWAGVAAGSAVAKSFPDSGRR